MEELQALGIDVQLGAAVTKIDKAGTVFTVRAEAGNSGTSRRGELFAGTIAPGSP